MASAMSVSKKDLLAMFKELGFKAAPKWNEKRLLDKVANLEDLLEDVEIPEEMQDDEDSLMNRILAAQEDGEKIVLADDKKKSSKKDAKEKGDDKKAKKGKKDKEDKKPKRTMNRLQAAVKVIAKCKKWTDKEDVVKNANDLYVENGGSDNVKESKWACRQVMDVMTCLELLNVEKDKIRLTK